MFLCTAHPWNQISFDRCGNGNQLWTQHCASYDNGWHVHVCSITPSHRDCSPAGGPLSAHSVSKKGTYSITNILKQKCATVQVTILYDPIITLICVLRVFLVLSVVLQCRQWKTSAVGCESWKCSLIRVTLG